MAEIAAHLVDHVFPPLPVRQWVLAVPKRLRYFIERDAALQGTVLRILVSEVERCLREHGTGSPADARIGAVALRRARILGNHAVKARLPDWPEGDLRSSGFKFPRRAR